MRKLRGGIFGCGMISEFHLLGWNRIPEVEIVALGNRTIEKAEKRRDQFAPGARIYNDLTTMLARERLDFVDILTAPELHREHCLQARQAGVHIICQKPLCHRFEDALALVNEMKDYPRIFAIHENHRFRPWFQTVLERFQARFFGTPRLVRFEHFNATGPREIYKNESETGVLLEYGSHLVDMMRSLLGEPERVYAREHRINPRVRGESLVHAVFEYPETTAVVEVGWKSAALTQGSMLLLGDTGEAWYEGTMTRGDSGRFRLTGRERVLVDEPRSPLEDYIESFYRLERECVDAMLGRGEITQTASNHLKTLRCTFAAYRAASSGEIVSVEAPA